nr:hypothetical protein [Clavibacter michiganensis]
MATASRSSRVAPGPVRMPVRADPPSTSQATPASTAPGASTAVTVRSASSPAPASAARIPRAPPATDARTAADASGPPVYAAVASPAPRPSSTTASESRSDSSAIQHAVPSRGAMRRSACRPLARSVHAMADSPPTGSMVRRMSATPPAVRITRVAQMPSGSVQTRSSP